jgi:hypothetical protein
MVLKMKIIEVFFSIETLYLHILRISFDSLKAFAIKKLNILKTLHII